VLVTFDSDAPDSKRRLFVGTDDLRRRRVRRGEVRDVLPDGGRSHPRSEAWTPSTGRDRRQGLIETRCSGGRSIATRTPDAIDAPLKGASTRSRRRCSTRRRRQGQDAHRRGAEGAPEAKCIVALWSYSAEWR